MAEKLPWCYEPAVDGAIDATGHQVLIAPEARTNFICQRVNAHDDLVAALKAVIHVADRNTVEFDMARAALSKAEGK